eukprot:scaffold240944_cov18-Tisochrysis_lutea.AAC.1
MARDPRKGMPSLLGADRLLMMHITDQQLSMHGQIRGQPAIDQTSLRTSRLYSVAAERKHSPEGLLHTCSFTLLKSAIMSGGRRVKTYFYFKQWLSCIGEWKTDIFLFAYT